MPAKFSLDIASNHGDLVAAVDALKRYKEEAKGVDQANDALARSGAKVEQGLNKVEKEAAEAGVALSNLEKRAKAAGVSTGQFAAGATNSFNQLSDVVVTLAGGMNPITVLIQQGPQLATAFGSVSGTLRVLLGFINPLTVGLTAVAGAVGFLAYEAYKDSKQMEGFTNALGKMGGQSGVTAQQLKALSEELQKSSGASEDVVNKAITSAASTSKTAEQMRLVAEAAINMSRATGESSDDMADKLSRLADDPLRALRELGDQYGILTPALYDNVRALVEAGDKTKAYELVLDAVNQKTKAFADQQKENNKGILDSWDALIAKAREYGLVAAQAGKGEGVTANLANGTKIPTATPKTGISWLDNANDETAKRNEEATNRIAAAIKNATGVQADLTKETQRYAKAQADAATAAMESDKLRTSTLKASQKTGEEIVKQEQRIAAIKAGGSAEELKRANEVLANLKQRQKEEEESEAKKGKNRKAANEAARAEARSLNEMIGANVRLLDIKAQIRELQEGNLKVTNEEKAAAHNRNMIELLSAEQAKNRLNAEQQRQLASMKANQAALDEAATASRTLETLKERQRLDQKHNDAMQAAADLSATIGMSEQQTNEYLEKQAQIRQRIKDNPLVSADDITKQVDQEYSARLDARKAKEADWLGGAKSGFQEWAESASNYSKQVGDAVSQGMDLGTEALTNFVTTGKLNFKSFTADILKMLAEIAVKMAIFNTIKAFGGGSAFGFAKGGVFNEPSLSVYRNQVIDKPTPFTFTGRSMFAKGGVFGEAGPEAIMPLSRDSNGRLGIKAEGMPAGGGGVNIEQLNVHVNDGNVTTDTGGARGDAIGKAYADAAAVGARNEIQKQLMNGGMIYNAMHARG